MTSDLPPEAHHYRRSQTPESPRPLHIPEPSNIPVLQNQMDPVFNDTTTYEIVPDSSLVSKPPDNNQPCDVAPGIPHQMSNTFTQPEGYSDGHSQADIQNSRSSNIVFNGTADNQAVSTNSHAQSSNATAPDLRRTLDSLAHFTESANANAEQAQNLSGAEALIENDTLPKAEPSASDSHAQPDSAVRPNSPDTASKGVNYQSLLDTLSQSTVSAPIADTLNASSAVSTNEGTTISQAGFEKPLPVAAGLPPRPPPQEKPAIHPNYSPNESIRSYHQLPPQNVNPPPYQSQTASYRPNAGIGSGNNIPPPQPNTRAANGLPPPPIATFQQSPASVAPIQSPSVQSLRDAGGRATESPSLRHDSQGIDDEEQPWGPEIQKKYDQFLHDERIYVTEGVWDRFPPGSRLFVGKIGRRLEVMKTGVADNNEGNLPTEKVTKRDLFHIFHKHGKLAQISLKQAYGFVQFLEASACYDALSKEQGVAIRGRKIREFSYLPDWCGEDL
jgi:RNA recognition motif. (a.k.a. RRM, RBD, or RNP domain)